MAIMNSDLYDALRSAGAEEDKARAAAESVAAYEGRFAKIDRDLGLLKWMMGFNLLFTAGVLWRLVDLGAQIASLSARLTGAA